MDAPTSGPQPPHHGGRSVQSRGSRVVRFTMVMATVAAVAVVAVVLVTGKRPAATALVPPPVNAPAAVPTSATLQGQGTAAKAKGPTGQILGIGGRCLTAGNGNGADSSSVVLATCTGTEDQQEWTLPDNKELMLGGRCLGVSPKDAKAGSLAGFYACNGTPSEMWSVQKDSTIRSVSSGLCLGSQENKDANGNPVWVTTCLPTAKAQSWTVPSYAADPSGLSMPVGNIPGWQQVFTDNFTEDVPVGDFPAQVSSKWGAYQDGWRDTTKHGTYEASKVVSIQNGMMNMYLHTQDGVHMVAAPYPIIPGATGPEGGTVYGMYEVRFKAQPVVGYKTAWLLWPDSENADDGEIDFPEGNLSQKILGYMHEVSPYVTDQGAYKTSYTYADWHTATTIWTSKSVIFLLDNKVIGDFTYKVAIPSTAMHYVLQTETRTGGGAPPNTSAGNVYVDWVSIWVPAKKS